MNRVYLRKLIIKNLGPIKEDEVTFEGYTYFVGRNNAGKSHYVKAIELLLATKTPTKYEITQLQNDKSKPITIEGVFEGVENFTSLISVSNHKQAIDKAIKEGILKVGRILRSGEDEESDFGVYQEDGSIYNPSGITTNLLKVLPDPISIPATADTIDELQNKQNTALSKLKKEALSVFFEELKGKTQESLKELDKFLNSEDEYRSKELINFEKHLKEEFVGEFEDVIPSVKFTLPDEGVIANEMRIILDDGYPSEVEQKGHGLQRAALLALLRVLAKYGMRYQDRPTPIFLIGELESFLHPYAQKQFSEVLLKLIDQYQIITTTHSPFIVSSENIAGYRRVQKTEKGTVSVTPNLKDLNVDELKRHLGLRGNLEGLFADRVVLIEGQNDENFFYKLIKIFGLKPQAKKFTLFIKSGGKEGTRVSRRFYKQMNFDDVAIICDLDYLFCSDFKYLLGDISMDPKISEDLRLFSNCGNKDLSLENLLDVIKNKGEPPNFDELLDNLSKNRIFVLKNGAPENYYKNNFKEKNGWQEIEKEDDLLEISYLKALMSEILK